MKVCKDSSEQLSVNTRINWNDLPLFQECLRYNKSICATIALHKNMRTISAISNQLIFIFNRWKALAQKLNFCHSFVFQSILKPEETTTESLYHLSVPRDYFWEQHSTLYVSFSLYSLIGREIKHGDFKTWFQTRHILLCWIGLQT